MLMFVGTPNLLARESRIASKLQSPSLRLTTEEQRAAKVFVREFMDSRWDSVRFLTFSESEAFANAVVELVVSKVLYTYYVTCLLNITFIRRAMESTD